MGGKTSQSSSQVSIPPEVLARYNSVNQTAQNVAQTPFQQYSTNPNAFVAPLTATQNAGVAGTNAAAGEAQPYFGAATGFALAGANPVDAAPLNTSQYMNPYLNTVLGATSAQLNQNNQQAMAGQTGSAINQGYFGGDRSGIASAVLQGQQNLAAGQVYSGIASDAYQQALAAAQQQQGVQLGAGQANRAALQGTAGTLAELGTGAQGAALSGAQAQLGAGQVEQQTQQAGDTALYNQFLQQQSYPFQTAQFLANIAEGTGALSGSTTTSTQPGSLFMSDERLKEDMQPIGKGFDGANIYRFRYKDDPENVTRLGFSAQEMARHHPEAVHSVGGFGAVDQAAATDESAHRGGFARAANDNFGDEPARMARQGGGLSEWGMYPEGANPMTIAQLLQAQEQSYAPFAQSGGLYGSSASGAPHGGSSYVPQANLPVGGLQIAHAPMQSQSSSPLHEAAEAAGDVTTLGKDASKVYDWGRDQMAAADAANVPANASGGFVRAHRDLGGGLSDPNDDNPYQPKGPGLDIPTAGAQHPQLATAKPPGGGGGSGMLGQAAGAAGDVSSLVTAGSDIAKFLPFIGLKRGGRIGFATGGEPTEQEMDARLVNDAHAAVAPQPPPPSPAAGFANAAAAPEEAPALEEASAPGFAGAEQPAAAPGAGPSGGAGGSLGHIIGLEGTGQNPRSSAIGVGQLLDKTYMGLLREAHPDIAAQVGSDPASIKAFRRTPQGLALSSELAPMNQDKNRAVMQNQGIAVTPTNEHVMWVLGAGDGSKVLHADPSTPLHGLISDAAIAANPSIMAGKTAGDFVNWARHGMAAGGRAGFADAGGVGDGISNTTGGDVYVDDSGNLHAAIPPPSPPPDDTRSPAPGFASADQTGGAGAPSALPPDVERAAQRQDQAQGQLQDVVHGQESHPAQGGNLFQQGLDWIGQPRHFMPLLQGAAAAASAPTRNPLTALLIGGAGAAQGYQQQRAYDVANANTAAEQGNLGLDAQVTAAGLPVRGYEAQTARIQANQAGLGTVLDYIKNGYTKTNIPDPTDSSGNSVMWRGPRGNLLTQSQLEGDRAELARTGAANYSGNVTNPFAPGSLDIGKVGGVAGGFGAAGPAGAVAANIAGASGDRPQGSVPNGAPGGGGAPGNAGPQPVPGRPALPGPPGAVPGGGGVAAVPAHPPGPVHAAAQPRGGAVPADPSLRLSPALRADLNSGVFQQAPAQQQVDNSQLQDDWNPDVINRNIHAITANGGDPSTWTARLKAVTSGEAAPYRQDGTQDFGYQHQQQQAAAAGERLKANTGLVDEQNRSTLAFNANKPQTMQAWNALNRIYQDWNFRGWSDHFADTLNGLESVPALRPFISSAQDQWAQAHTDAAKSAVRLQLTQAIESSLAHGAPATTLDTLKLQTPSPDMAPAARYDLNVQNLALLRQKADWSGVWNASKNHVDDPAAFYQRWMSENPIQRYTSEAYDDVRPYAGMQWGDMAQHPRHPQSQADYDKMIRTYPKGVPIQVNGQIIASPGPKS